MAAIVLTVCSLVRPVFFVLNFFTKSVVVIGLWARYLRIVVSVIAKGSLLLDKEVSDGICNDFCFLLESCASFGFFELDAEAET